MIGVQVRRLNMEVSGGGEGMKEIREGGAVMLFPSTNEVFYNPVQVFNRDLSVAVLNTYSQVLQAEREELQQQKKQQQQQPQRIDVLEALSATGLRAIRYSKEVEGLTSIIANDLSASAVAAIRRNVQHNGLDPLTQVIPNEADAT